jgi:uncharacterized protein YjbI with pentapeptide repeats
MEMKKRNLSQITLNKLIVIKVLIATTFIRYGFQNETVNATGGEVKTGADLAGANLTGANLLVVKLVRTIFCNTNMPEGRINKSGCNN